MAFNEERAIEIENILAQLDVLIERSRAVLEDTPEELRVGVPKNADEWYGQWKWNLLACMTLMLSQADREPVEADVGTRGDVSAPPQDGLLRADEQREVVDGERAARRQRAADRTRTHHLLLCRGQGDQQGRAEARRALGGRRRGGT